MRHRGLIIEAKPLKKSKRTWIGGGDLEELSQLKTKDAGREYIEAMSNVCWRLQILPVPVICVIEGHAIGGGAELALACDIRLGTKDCVLEFKQLRVGLATGFGGCERLIDLIGVAKAQEILLLSKSVGSKLALELGLIHQVIELEESDKRKELNEVLHSIRLAPPECMAAQKEMINNRLTRTSPSSGLSHVDTFMKLWMEPAHKNFLKGYFNRDKV